MSKFSGSERIVMPIIDSTHSSHNIASKNSQDLDFSPITNEFQVEGDLSNNKIRSPPLSSIKQKDKKDEADLIPSPKPSYQVPRLVSGKRFILNCSMAHGSFGKILLCLDTHSNKMRALKVEPVGPKQLLEFETMIYRELHSVGESDLNFIIS